MAERALGDETLVGRIPKKNSKMINARLSLSLCGSKRRRLLVPMDDNDAGVRVHVDDLPPQSSMRRILVHDDLDTLECGFGRDVLLSMLASYRHNKVILKNGATKDEVLCEMERDLVRIQLSTMHPLEQQTSRLCQSLVVALEQWPAMRFAMERFFIGGYCDWDCGPLHVRVEFVSKPQCKFQELTEKPACYFLRYVCAQVYSDKKSSFTSSDVRQSFPIDRIEAILDGLDDEDNFFWFMPYDRGALRFMPTHNPAHWLYNFILGLNEDDPWRNEFIRCVSRLYDRIPDVVRMLDPRAPSFAFFCEALANRNLKFTVDDEKARRMTFPTMWHKTYRRNHNIVITGTLSLSGSRSTPILYNQSL